MATPYLRHVYIFDYNTGLPIYYTQEEYANLQAKEELKRKQERLHILKVFLVAIDNSDYIVKIITGSANIAETKEKLTRTFPLSQKQVSVILKMKLNEFTNGFFRN